MSEMPPSQQPPVISYNTPPAPKENLRLIASSQKALMYCILGEIVCYGSVMATKGSLISLVFALGYFAVAIVAMVFVFKLGIQLYGTAVGIVMGICTLIPCIGLLILLVISQKATTKLKAAGIPVGLMGARVKIEEIP